MKHLPTLPVVAYQLDFYRHTNGEVIIDVVLELRRHPYFADSDWWQIRDGGRVLTESGEWGFFSSGTTFDSAEEAFAFWNAGDYPTVTVTNAFLTLEHEPENEFNSDLCLALSARRGGEAPSLAPGEGGTR